MTNATEVSAKPLLTYFKPLQEFLKQQIPLLKKDDEVRQLLSRYEVDATAQCNKLQKAEWGVVTDLNNNTKHEILTKTVLENAKFSKDQYERNFRQLKASDYIDERIRRQISNLNKLGTDALDEAALNEFTEVKANLEKIYNNAVFCGYHKPDCNLATDALTLDPEITKIMASSSDFEQLKYTWVQWHNKSGAPMRDDYKKYVRLGNQAAKLNGLGDYGELWRMPYEEPNLSEKMQKIWKQVEPLYNEIHTFVRRNLIELYPNKIDTSDPLIPAHLLGNMWAQTWIDLYERIKPFKNSSSIDITETLKVILFARDFHVF